MFILRPVLGKDADILFSGIFNASVTDTIQWDGPMDLDEYRKALEEREKLHKEGKAHFFTILEEADQTAVGSINIRPDNDFRANIGLWVGQKYQGRGAGTSAVAAVVKYGFEVLKLQKIEAYVFVGNHSSRKIFEKNGFILEGTLRSVAKKRGKLVDEWVLGIVAE